MRALLITLDGVEAVEHDGSLESFYRLIGCDCMCLAGVPDRGHAAWVDDEGLFKLKEGTQMTHVAWHPQALAGRILVTGSDEVGNTTPATLSVEELVSQVVIGRLSYA